MLGMLLPRVRQKLAARPFHRSCGDLPAPVLRLVELSYCPVSANVARPCVASTRALLLRNVHLAECSASLLLLIQAGRAGTLTCPCRMPGTSSDGWRPQPEGEPEKEGFSLCPSGATASCLQPGPGSSGMTAAEGHCIRFNGPS